MAFLIIAFIVLLLLLTGTFLSALGVIGWLVLAVLGTIILYLAIVAPIKRRLLKSDAEAMAELRAKAGYSPLPKSPVEEMRSKLGYEQRNEREM